MNISVFCGAMFSAALSKVHWTFFTLAVLCAVAMMAGCKGGAANDTIAIDTMPDCTSLFDGLQYNDEGIAFIKDITIEVNGGGRYDFDKDAPVYAGKWGCSAVGFARNAAFNTHTCMVYNMCRYEQILRLGMN